PGCGLWSRASRYLSRATRQQRQRRKGAGMCGIAGIVASSTAHAAVSNQGQLDIAHAARAMTLSLAHRGPDGEGFYIDGRAALGHRRLAIVDLQGGKQPLCNEDETVWISYNGEVYNHVHLRRELSARGHHFKTRCDTEAIVHSYEEWGVDCPLRLRG